MTQPRDSDVISGDVLELRMLIIIKVAKFYAIGTRKGRTSIPNEKSKHMYNEVNRIVNPLNKLGICRVRYLCSISSCEGVCK